MMDREACYIVGSGGHGRVIRDTVIATAGGRYMRCFFADDYNEFFRDLLPEEIPEGARVLVGIGDNLVREEMVLRLKSLGKSFMFPTAQHPTAYISPSCAIGYGVVVFARAVVNPDSDLGDFSIINTGATVDHDCIIGDFAHIAPGVNLCGTVRVGERTIVGVGSCARPKITIGSDTIIGAGSVIVNDIPSHVVAYGNPCRVIKEIE